MEILYDLFKTIDSDNISGLTDELKVLYIDYLYKKQNQNIIVLTSNLYQATRYYDLLRTYNNNVLLFPMDEFLTSVAVAISPDLKVKRLETLNKITNSKNNIVVTNLTGFLKYVPNSRILEKLVIKLEAKTDINRKTFEELLEKFGYNKTSLVSSSGEYSVRGFVIDLFPYNMDNPIRIELFGNTIETIKSFDSETQLSISEHKSIEIVPYDEITTSETTSIYSLMGNPIVVFVDPELIKSTYYNLQEQMMNYKKEKEIPQTHKYMFDLEDIKIKKQIDLSTFNTKGSYDLNSKTLDNFNNNFNVLKLFVENNLSKNKIIFCITNNKVQNYVKELFKISKSDKYETGKIYLENKKINNGFIINNYIFISDNDIENRGIKHSYNNTVKIGRKIKDFNDIKKGDYVVHTVHGIGIYNGVVTLSQNGVQKDYLQINYAGNDKIYIPVEKINTIFKYSDGDGTPPRINKLNSPSWEKTKSTVKAKVKSISKELLRLYAERSKVKSPMFIETPEDLVFANNFEYSETNDQTKCIRDILQDLRTDKPMDRLLCGDVGFGKTEVAFRAIFNTIINGYQVAYLCPTTILSKQQYSNALERFKDFAINIKIVNRFTSQKEFNSIVRDLEEGKIDLVFGTHRLFNEKIKYKNLGLLVVDEEQRFGVTQKEKIKELTKNINVLTLSATPIPRTLKMAMTGLKDLSILDTAPEDRYPVQTYVIEESDVLIKEAIYKELSRNGQVFYLYNNVANIEEEANRLKRLVPEASICFAHGQMDKQNLESVIEDIVDKKYDILVCTTIIETGIDISNVNTLIIIDAQNYGLSQLYQLRGRVGRSNKIAYAYLTYRKNKILNEAATKRLSAIKEFTELGSGYKIAMRDLSIRGAGDILGSEQAGFIDSVGIEMYTKLIEETINELHGIETPEETVNDKTLINVDTHIDESYVSDESVRIEIHQLINQIKDYKSLTKIKNEIEDRFGKIDEKMEIYMYEEWFEKLALDLNINNVIQTKTYIELYLPPEVSSKLNGEKLFLKLYSINPKFTIRYISKRIIIRLPIINIERHYLYYLVELLEEISNDIE